MEETVTEFINSKKIGSNYKVSNKFSDNVDEKEKDELVKDQLSLDLSYEIKNKMEIQIEKNDYCEIHSTEIYVFTREELKNLMIKLKVSN